MVAVLMGGGCVGAGIVLDLEGDLKLEAFEDRLGVAGVGSEDDRWGERRRFGKKNLMISGSG